MGMCRMGGREGGMCRSIFDPVTHVLIGSRPPITVYNTDHGDISSHTIYIVYQYTQTCTYTHTHTHIPGHTHRPIHIQSHTHVHITNA